MAPSSFFSTSTKLVDLVIVTGRIVVELLLLLMLGVSVALFSNSSSAVSSRPIAELMQFSSSNNFQNKIKPSIPSLNIVIRIIIKFP